MFYSNESLYDISHRNIHIFVLRLTDFFMPYYLFYGIQLYERKNIYIFKITFEAIHQVKVDQEPCVQDHTLEHKTRCFT